MTQSTARRLLRQTLTIARRDFVATVFTPTFLLFLFAPLIMLSFGAVGGMGAQSVAQGSDEKERIVALAPDASIAAMRAADERLRTIFPRDEQPPQLVVRPAPPAPGVHARTLFDTRETDTTAVLYGPLDRPTILFGPMGARASRYLAALAEATLRTERSGGSATLSRPTLTPVTRATASLGGRSASAFFSVFGIFFLTLLLAGQAVGTMAEERSNKVIEVLAAAVPLESVFLGKLLGMFGVAVLFVVFWGTLVSQVGALAPAGLGAALSQLSPAIGMGTYALLFFAYFTMSYMLLGAVFLSVGAQASTMREIQMLSLPITIVQVAMFGWSAAGASRPDSWVAVSAQIFPLSSPYAMAARAAQSPLLWPHLLAFAWQTLWVAIVITIGARAFRRGVLQSGSAKFRWPWMRSRPQPATDA